MSEVAGLWTDGTITIVLAHVLYAKWFDAKHAKNKTSRYLKVMFAGREDISIDMKEDLEKNFLQALSLYWEAQ